MAEEPDYKAELAEAVRIAREDRMYAKLHSLEGAAPTDPPVTDDPPKAPEGGPPPPKPEPNDPPKAKKGGWWGDQLADPPDPSKPVDPPATP